MVFSTPFSWSLSTEAVLDFRGRSGVPTFSADFRKSLFVHLKLPVEEDTVLLGDSLFGGCGGSVLETSGDFDFDDELCCFEQVFDFDSTEVRDSDDGFVFELDLTELLLDSDADCDDDFDRDFFSESVSLLSFSLFVEFIFEELPFVEVLPNLEYPEELNLLSTYDQGVILDVVNLEYFVGSSIRSD